MTESRLSLKTKLCAFIQNSNEKERRKILQAFYDETTSSHTSSHDATSLMRFLFTKDENEDHELFTNSSLRHLCQSIYNMKQQETENNTTNNNTKAYKTEHDKSSAKIGKNDKNNKDVFKRLPLEMITLIAYLLSKKDIIKFERCCRVMYQTINNDSFLTNYNCFRGFVLDEPRLINIEKNMTKLGFFKLRFVKHLILQLRYGDAAASHNEQKKFKTRMIKYFNVILDACQSDSYYDDWLFFMFKSITQLEVMYQGNIFWPSLPIDLLFNKDTSNLAKILINGDEVYGEYYEQFKKKYVEWFQLNMNNAKIIDYVNCSYGANSYCIGYYMEINSYFQLFNAKHLRFCRYKLDPKSFSKFAIYHPHLDTLTFDMHALNNNNSDSDNSDNDDSNQLHDMDVACESISAVSHDDCEPNIQIRTLKLTSTGYEYFYSGTMAEPVNWMHSLKHVTAHLRGKVGRDFAWCLARGDSTITMFETYMIEALSTKYSFQLESMNLLFDFNHGDYGYKNEGLKDALAVVDWFFSKFWAKVINILPNTLMKQVNVGWRIKTQTRNSIIECYKEYDYVFSWKPSVSGDYLKQMQQNERECRIFCNDPTKRQYSPGCLRFENLI